jgi:hypothetical protein
MKTPQTLALLLFCTILSSCSANRLLSSWSDSYFEESSIAPVLIVGIARDETKRRIYEDTFVDSLTLAKTKSVASYTASKQSIEPNEKALREVVKKTGAKTVLITHMVSENEKDFYQPATIVHGTNSYSTPGLYRYYPFIYNSVFTSGSYNSTTKVVLETNLYDVETEKLIWTARSESIDPVMTRKYYQQLINLFLNDLASKNLL